MAAYTSQSVSTADADLRARQGAQLIDENFSAEGACRIARLSKKFSTNTFVLLDWTDTGESCWCNLSNGLRVGVDNGTIQRDSTFEFTPSEEFFIKIVDGKFVDFELFEEKTQPNTNGRRTRG